MTHHPARAAALARAFVCAFVIALGLGPWSASRASSTRYCDQSPTLSAAQQDRLFRFAGVIKQTLEESGASLALVSRSGLDLSRFGMRYSHAGVSLKQGLDTAWSVRQLYYDCDESKPRLFDQGVSGFVLGLSDPAAGYVSVVTLPEPEAAALERAVLDRALALRALGTRYSANAHAFSVAYQNCNQWVAEMLAGAWGPPPDPPDPLITASIEARRQHAQAWLAQQGYQPSVFDVGFRPWMWLGRLIPHLHEDDHPAADLAQARFRVSMPASIEAFVQARVLGARRLEFCQADTRIVIRRGWTPIAEGCVAGEQDTTITLE